MTISELMLQRQALIEQTQATEDAIRDALATLYNIHPGDHAKCFKRTISIVSTHVTFRGDIPRLYVTGTDINDPEATYRYGWDPKHCRVLKETP